MTRAPSWRCTLAYPPHWVELHLDDGVPQVEDDLIAALAAGDAAQGAVLSAHGYTADPEEGSIHRHLAVWILPREHEAVDAELSALAADYRDAAHSDLAEPRFERRNLPAGEALRVVRIDAADNDNDNDNGSNIDDAMATGPIVLSVSYLIPVSSPDRTLWLRFWTPNLLAADDLVDEFDAMARALEVTIAP